MPKTWAAVSNEHLRLISLLGPALLDVALISGGFLPTDPSEWDGALVLVESGVIELETPGGFCGQSCAVMSCGWPDYDSSC
jgi:hypothetical protein